MVCRMYRAVVGIKDGQEMAVLVENQKSSKIWDEIEKKKKLYTLHNIGDDDAKPYEYVKEGFVKTEEISYLKDEAEKVRIRLI